MAKTVSDMSISLDGFITAPGDAPEEPMGDGGMILHDWMFKNPKVFEEVLSRMRATTGSIIMGRHSYEVAHGWGDEPPFHMPIFVLTHKAEPPLTKKGGTTSTFVTDGLESGLHQAQAAAGDSLIGVHGATVAQQLLGIGQLDELNLHVVPVLLGAGKRLFEAGDLEPIDLELISSQTDAGVLHLRYRVLGRSRPL